MLWHECAQRWTHYGLGREARQVCSLVVTGMFVFQIMCETYVLRDSSLPLRSGIRHAEPAWNGRGTAPTSQGFPLVLLSSVLILEYLSWREMFRWCPLWDSNPHVRKGFHSNSLPPCFPSVTTKHSLFLMVHPNTPPLLSRWDSYNVWR